MSDRTLVLLPGLAADERMFQRQRDRFPNLHVPQWIAPRPEESLVSYAARYAEILKDLGPEFLGGASFGGMVALEIARILRPRIVFLLGSCRSPAAIAPVWRSIGAVTLRIPRAFIRPSLLPGFLLRWVMGPLDRNSYATLETMRSSASPSFVMWGLRALLDWPGIEGADLSVFQIHGDRDHILPIRHVRADRVIAGAGHLLTLTHATEVNDAMREAMDRPRRWPESGIGVLSPLLVADLAAVSLRCGR